MIIGGKINDPVPNSNVILGSIVGALYTGLAYATMKYGTKIKTGKSKEADKIKMFKLRNLATNVTLVSTMITMYYLGNPRKIKPGAVIAGIPIGTIEELSHALSDRVLKYRATGGVFLAHQGGGNETLRIVAKAWGKNRYMFLTAMDFLFLYGSSTIIDLFASLGNSSFSRISKKGFKKTKSINPWNEFKHEAIDEGREEFRLTFPVITRNRVYTNMYIETYDVIESVENGRNMLTITLFFRKWLPPNPLEFVRIVDQDNDANFWYRESTEPFTKTIGFTDAVLDFGLSIVIQLHTFLMEQEYSAYSEEQYVALMAGNGLDKSLADQAKEEDREIPAEELNILANLVGMF